MKMRKYRMNKVSIFVLLCLVLMIQMSFPVFAAELVTTETISVEKQISGDKPGSAIDFMFKLTADEPGYPMPEGARGDTLIIKGAGTGSFDSITYTEPNDYTYTVTEIKGNAANYTYDESVYKVLVRIITDDDGNLDSAVWVQKNGNQEKAEKILFVNSYKAPIVSTPSEPGTNSPKTGDTTEIVLWIGLIGISSIILTLCVFIYPKKEKCVGFNKKG